MDPVWIVVGGGIPIYYYSLCFVVGTVLTIGGLRQMFREAGRAWVHLQWLIVLSMTGLFVGARLGHCCFYEFAYFGDHLLEIFIPIRETVDGYIFVGYQGMSSHGGVLGLIAALFVFRRITGERLLPVLDNLAILLPLAAAFIRLGNFMNSEMYGIPTDGSWGVVFDRVDQYARHPAQLYEAIAYFLLFIVNRICYRKVIAFSYPGFCCGFMLMMVFTARFVIEFFKEKQVSFEDHMLLDLGQVLSIPFILLGLYLQVRALHSTTNSKL